MPKRGTAAAIVRRVRSPEQPPARIDVTPAIACALAAITEAERAYKPGVDSSSLVENPLLELADAVLAAIAQARRRSRGRPPRTAPGLGVR